MWQADIMLSLLVCLQAGPGNVMLWLRAPWGKVWGPALWLPDPSLSVLPTPPNASLVVIKPPEFVLLPPQKITSSRHMQHLAHGPPESVLLYRHNMKYSSLGEGGVRAIFNPQKSMQDGAVKNRLADATFGQPPIEALRGMGRAK